MVPPCISLYFSKFRVIAFLSEATGHSLMFVAFLTKGGIPASGKFLIGYVLIITFKESGTFRDHPHSSFEMQRKISAHKHIHSNTTEKCQQMLPPAQQYGTWQGSWNTAFFLSKE